MFGRHSALPLDHTPSTFTFTRPNDYWSHFMKVMNVYRQAAQYQMKIRQHQSKRRFDRNRKDPHVWYQLLSSLETTWISPKIRRTFLRTTHNYKKARSIVHHSRFSIANNKRGSCQWSKTRSPTMYLGDSSISYKQKSCSVNSNMYANDNDTGNTGTLNKNHYQLIF